jgi:hypothetical protein
LGSHRTCPHRPEAVPARGQPRRVPRPWMGSRWAEDKGGFAVSATWGSGLSLRRAGVETANRRRNLHHLGGSGGKGKREKGNHLFFFLSFFRARERENCKGKVVSETEQRGSGRNGVRQTALASALRVQKTLVRCEQTASTPRHGRVRRGEKKWASREWCGWQKRTYPYTKTFPERAGRRPPKAN